MSKFEILELGGRMDEITAEGVDIHLEEMADGHWSLVVYKGGSTRDLIRLWIEGDVKVLDSTPTSEITVMSVDGPMTDDAPEPLFVDEPAATDAGEVD